MKSLLCAMLALLTCSAFAQEQRSVGTLSVPGGRFVLGQISQARADQFLLDTQTGKVWQLVCKKKEESGTGCSLLTFQPVSFSMFDSEAFTFQPTPQK